MSQLVPAHHMKSLQSISTLMEATSSILFFKLYQVEVHTRKRRNYLLNH